jgi:hypothetical protein
MSSGEKVFLTNYEEYFDRNDPQAIALVDGFADLLPEQVCEQLRRKSFEEARAYILSTLLSTHNGADSWDPYELIERGYYRDR